MKKFLVCTILLLSSCSTVAACEFSPFGEDLRYHFLNPNYYGLSEFQRFYYNANTFDPSKNEGAAVDENVWDWYHYLNRKVDPLSIQQFLYHSDASDLHSESKNQFVGYLYSNNKNRIINYLKWAKQCEEFTTFDDSKTWERDEVRRKISAHDFLKKLKEEMRNEKDVYLKRRFAFLAIRLAFYANDFLSVKNLHQTNFSSGKKDFIYYWSLYFYCFTDAKKDIDLANIVHYSSEKRNAIFYNFRNTYSLDKALFEANSDQERANAYAFLGMQNIHENLKNLTHIYQLTKHNKQLNFLLIREISKLEDWIYTPYYTYFEPSTASYLEGRSYEKHLAHAFELKKQGELNARSYAKELLAFVLSCDLKLVDNSMLWQSAIVQLRFMSQDYNGCIRSAKQFIRTYPNENASLQVRKIMVLASVAKQAMGKATIPTEFHEFVLQQLDDERFKFSLARELEYLGNYSDAIALMSGLFKEDTYYEYPGIIYWQYQRRENNRAKGCLVEFSEYFSYIDYAYSISQLKAVVKGIESHAQTAFYSTLYKTLKKDKNYILDMLGMKYIRQNDLKGALAVYEEMSPVYWENNYSAWERDEYDGGYYCFDKNPFFQIKYTKDFIEPNSKIKLTKVNVLKQLIFHLERAKNSKNQRRDKDYFYVATCYFNMSQHGNSWMMRRFSSTWYFQNDHLLYNQMYEDEAEYRDNLLAQKYYRLAEHYAEGERFKALCFRMYEYVKKINKEDICDYHELIKKYPKYYRQLSTCENLNEYFK